MKKYLTLLAVAVACAPCVDWTRFTGSVKAVNLKSSTVTIQLKGGDIITVPVDYQVKIEQKHETVRALRDLSLDDKITLLRVQADAPPPDDMTGMAQPDKR